MPDPTVAELNDWVMRTVRAERERDNAYRERARLVAHLAALHPSHVGYGDPDAPIWAVVTIETPAGQMSWHIAPRDVPLFAHVRPTSDSDRPWDGHSTEEKYLRLEALIGRASEEIDCRRCGAEPEN